MINCQDSKILRNFRINEEKRFVLSYIEILNIYLEKILLLLHNIYIYITIYYFLYYFLLFLYLSY